jgi:hypothetical protein
MVYNAKVVQVMIASPSDVKKERFAVREILNEWNDLNAAKSNLVLLPIGWDTHSAPDMSGSAQDIINEHVLKHADLLVGVFWTRVGTATGKSVSGSVEEIQKHIEAEKPVMIYFSSAPVAPESIDQDQYSKLQDFKSWCKDKGLVGEYSDISDFREKFRKQLQITVNTNNYISKFASEKVASDLSGIFEELLPNKSLLTNNKITISKEAISILVEASRDRDGIILHRKYIGGESLSINGKEMFPIDSGRREIAKWEGALEELENLEFIVSRDVERSFFEITQKGYDYVEKHLS